MFNTHAYVEKLKYVDYFIDVHNIQFSKEEKLYNVLKFQ